jgi:hypothetical protein
LASTCPNVAPHDSGLNVQIALAGYPDAVSKDRAAQSKAVSQFLSDAVKG